MIDPRACDCGLLLAPGRARCGRCTLADPGLEIRNRRGALAALRLVAAIALVALVAATVALARTCAAPPARGTVPSSPPCWRPLTSPPTPEFLIMARTRSTRDNPDEGIRKVREFTDDLERTLTAEGRTGEALQLAELLHEYEQIEDAKKRANKEWGERMKKIRIAMTAASKAARTGKRTESVKIEEIFHVDTGEVMQVATDTGEVIKVRHATPEEVDEYADFGVH